MKKKVLVAFTLVALSFSLTGCASWSRIGKNVKSEVDNGLKREIKVYNVDGKVIFSQKGKFDIKYEDHDLQYVDSHNLKHNIYIGSGTVVVDELK